MNTKQQNLFSAEPGISSGAAFSPCRTWRYSLWRFWGGAAIFGNYVAFVCLNPSTADEVQDDPTVRRCIRYAKDWGYGGMAMLNLFAFRATDPEAMKRAKDPVGPENDIYLSEWSAGARVTVCAWGAQGVFLGRDKEVLPLLHRPHYLALTADGQPRHPLYLKAALKPKPLAP